MKKVVLLIVLFSYISAIVLANPFWPIWGQQYHAQYGDGSVLILPSDLNHFLQNNHYSFWQHFSAVFSLSCLYATSVFILLSFIFRKKKNTTLVFSVISASLLIVSAILLPFTCAWSSIPFCLYCLFPLVAGILMLLKELITRKQQSN